MKTIGFKDRQGGPIRLYVNRSKPEQNRHDRIKEALNDLRRTANIVVYLIDGRKVRKLFVRGM